MAPELLAGALSRRVPTSETDVAALGSTAIEVLGLDSDNSLRMPGTAYVECAPALGGCVRCDGTLRVPEVGAKAAMRAGSTWASWCRLRGWRVASSPSLRVAGPQ